MKTKRTISLIVAILFFVNNISYALGPAVTSNNLAEETRPGAKGEMYALGQKLFAAKIGPGSIDFDGYIGEFEELQPSLTGIALNERIDNYNTKFIKADYENLPADWKENNPILQQTDLIRALKMFRERSRISSGKLEIKEGWFPVDEKKGELPIARIEQLGEGRYALVVHTKFVRMWDHIRKNDVWFEVDLEPNKRRTVSVAWGIFYRLAKHEMADLSKRDGMFKGLGHIVYKMDGPHDNETFANEIGGNYAMLNDAIWMWFLGSYCFTNNTRYDNNVFLERIDGFFEGRWALERGLPLEFPNLLKNPVNRLYAMAFACAINSNFFNRPGVEVPNIDGLADPKFIEQYQYREEARILAGVTEESLYATGGSTGPAAKEGFGRPLVKTVDELARFLETDKIFNYKTEDKSSGAQHIYSVKVHTGIDRTHPELGGENKKLAVKIFNRDSSAEKRTILTHDTEIFISKDLNTVEEALNILIQKGFHRELMSTFLYNIRIDKAQAASNAASRTKPGKSPEDLIKLIAYTKSEGRVLSAPMLLKLYEENYKALGFEKPAEKRNSALKTIERDLYILRNSLIMQGLIQSQLENGRQKRGEDNEYLFELTENGREEASKVRAQKATWFSQAAGDTKTRSANPAEFWRMEAEELSRIIGRAENIARKESDPEAQMQFFGLKVIEYVLLRMKSAVVAKGLPADIVDKESMLKWILSIINGLVRNVGGATKDDYANSIYSYLEKAQAEDLAPAAGGAAGEKADKSSSPVKLVDGAKIVAIANKNIKDGTWGTAGYRGVKTDPNDFTIDNVNRQTAGFAEEVLKRMSKGEYAPINGKTVRVAFAFDSRKDSDDYAYEMAKVLAAYEGFEVDILDEALPTPIVARLTQKKRAQAYDFAFHVTPSHNQLKYGGIKLLFEGSVNEHMWTYFFEKRANAKMEYPVNPNARFKNTHVADQLIEEYLNDVFPGLVEKFNAFKRLNPDAQFIVDLMDGSMVSFTPLFERLGIKVVRRGQMKNIDYTGKTYVLADGKEVGFAPDPTQGAFYKDEPEYREFLKSAPDGSIYFLIDGDGDRLVTLVKKSSEPTKVGDVKPNQFGPLAFDYILTNKLIPEMKRLVRTYVTTAGVDAVARYHGLPATVIVPVGSKYFNSHFHAAGGLEESGHFAVPGFFDDTIYQVGLILSMMSDTNKDVFTLLAEMQERTGYKGVDKRDDFEELTPEVKAKFIAPLTGTPEDVRAKTRKAVEEIVKQSGKELLEALVVVEGEYGVGRVVNLKEYVDSLFTDNPLVIESNNKGIIVRFKDLSWGGARLSGTGNTGRLYTEGRESHEERQKIADAFINTLDLPRKAAPTPVTQATGDASEKKGDASISSSGVGSPVELMSRNDLEELVKAVLGNRIDELVKSGSFDALQKGDGRDELISILSVKEDQYDWYYSFDENNRNKKTFLSWLEYLTAPVIAERRDLRPTNKEIEAYAKSIYDLLAETKRQRDEDREAGIKIEEPVIGEKSVVAEKLPIVSAISDYVVDIALDKGPGSVKPTTEEIASFYPIYEILSHQAVEIYLPQAAKGSLTDMVKQEIANLNKRIMERTGRKDDAISFKAYDANNLERLLENRNEGARRIFVNDNTMTDVFKDLLIQSKAAALKGSRLITTSIPQTQDKKELSVYQAWLVKVALLSAMVEESNMLTVGSALQDELKDRLDNDIDINEFVMNLAGTENEAIEQVAARINYFLGKIVKVSQFIGEQIRILKAFWIAA